MDRLGFPQGFGARTPQSYEATEAVMADHDEVRRGRRYATPLLLTLVAQVEQWLAHENLDSSATTHEQIRSVTDVRGNEANQLILRTTTGTLVTLRPIYNKLETLVVGDMMRLGFPTGPGYNTGQWRRFAGTVDSLLKMAPSERRQVAADLWSLIVALERQQFATGRSAVPRPFTRLLETFEPRQSNENEGALLQGLAYAYYRADAPNIDLDPGRSRAGSARTQRIGDIDGYSGNELVLTIEVKDDRVGASNVSRFDDWLVKLPDFPNALAVALARDFDAQAQEHLADRAVAILDMETMLKTVALWDLGKQQLAARGFWFYLNRIEREPHMIRRFNGWCEDHGITLWFSGQAED